MKKEEIKKHQRSQRRNLNWRIFLATILFIIAGLLFAAGPIRTFLLSRLQSQQIEAASNITLAEVKANEAEEAEFDFSKVEAID